MSDATIVPADPEGPEARACLLAYYAVLDARFPDGFDVTLSRDPEARDMRPPRGTFLLARAGAEVLGCVGLKRSGPTEAEIKRLWISETARGQGLGRRLMAEAEAAARALGIATLRLDTNETLTEAIALYRKTGWQEIADFNGERFATHWFEKGL
ncbi:GNAT family N-acetyltransferase [Litorisediminicola beolgyonensis]|uniref:GNAT family N-acetyltransferase n=1 Tax=Litorisediminicola beolgyonensis TaxID=1173614 RepID=A0ABW3ZNH3_9RHOB